jgi:adenylate kinase family enzyme
MVIGGSGAGKSTFALALAARTGLPLYHLDREFWQADWTEPSPQEWRERVSLLTGLDRWIMEGTYTNTLDVRLPRADLVLWFDFPRHVCLYRVVRRVLRYYGEVRPDLAPGCPERFDLNFLKFVWTFNDHYRPRIVDALHRYAPQLEPVVFGCDADADRFLQSLPRQT